MSIKKAMSGGYHVGNELCSRIRRIERDGEGLGNRKMVVTLTNGDQYTIAQLDRDYFEVNGPNLTNCRVKGWSDGLRLVDSI